MDEDTGPSVVCCFCSGYTGNSPLVTVSYELATIHVCGSCIKSGLPSLVIFRRVMQDAKVAQGVKEAEQDRAAHDLAEHFGLRAVTEPDGVRFFDSEGKFVVGVVRFRIDEAPCARNYMAERISKSLKEAPNG